MKEKLIVEISNAMAEALNVEQMALLNGVLLRVVSKYNITADEETKQATDETNESLLHSFLSATQVEGCSGQDHAQARDGIHHRRHPRLSRRIPTQA